MDLPYARRTQTCYFEANELVQVIAKVAVGSCSRWDGHEQSVRLRIIRNRYYHERLRIAGNAVRKDGHQSWDRRKIAHRSGSKGGIGPPCYWIYREKGNLAVVDAAQLNHRVVCE